MTKKSWQEIAEEDLVRRETDIYGLQKRLIDGALSLDFVRVRMIKDEIDRNRTIIKRLETRLKKEKIELDVK